MMIMKWIAGAVLGAALGWAYQRFVGCADGTCPLTRHAWITMLYGALIGWLIASSSH